MSKNSPSKAGIRSTNPTKHLNRHGKKYKAFLRHVARKNAIADAMDRRGYWKQAQALRECSETEHLTGCTHCGEAWWVTTKCRQRVCPICSYKVSKDRAKLIQLFINRLKYPKFVTLTMPRWTGDPREGIKELRSAFLRLRKNGGIKELKGGCYSIELVPKDDGWHIHMHLILDAPFIPHAKLIVEWGKALRVPRPSVDVRNADKGSAAHYVAKYVTKSLPPDVEADTYVDLWEAIKGSRLFALFGDWYKDKQKISALGGDDANYKAKCPCCGATGTMFDVRCGRFVYGKEWDTIYKDFEPKDGLCSRAIPNMYEITTNEIDQETYIEDEDILLMPYNT